MTHPTEAARRFWRWIGGHSLAVIAAVLIVAGGTWGFVALAGEVVEGDTQAFDVRAVEALRHPDGSQIGPGWLREMGRDATALGGILFLTLLAAIVVGFLLIRGQRGAAGFVAASTAGAWLASSALKWGFDRPRPDVVPQLSVVYTSSFPSGHSMLSAAVYLTLGGLLARFVRGEAVKAYLLGCAVFLTLLVGVSRVYMGVHYPTDVLAGWTAGAVWAMLCWLAARWLQQRGGVEREGETRQGLSVDAAA